tara:strand:- start:369 stop:1556 length:1188 start_codon:yes stop_codon:yes gene_type:complete
MLLNLVFSSTKGGAQCVSGVPRDKLKTYKIKHFISLISPGTNFSAFSHDTVSSIYLMDGSFSKKVIQHYTEDLNLMFMGLPTEYSGESGAATLANSTSPMYHHHGQMNEEVDDLTDLYSRFILFSNDWDFASGDFICRPTEIMQLAGFDVVATITNCVRTFNPTSYCNYELSCDGTGEMILPLGTLQSGKPSLYSGVYYTAATSDSGTWPALNGCIFTCADLYTGMSVGYTLKIVLGVVTLEFATAIGQSTLTYDLSQYTNTRTHFAIHATATDVYLLVDGLIVKSVVDVLVPPTINETPALAGDGLGTNLLTGSFDIFCCFEGEQADKLNSTIRRELGTTNRSACGYRKQGGSFSPILPTFSFNFDDAEYDPTDTHSRSKFGSNDRAELLIELL